MPDRNVPSIILQKLQSCEPNAEFSGTPPKLTSSSGKQYFVKVGNVREKEQYTGEAESLKAICKSAPGLAPNILAQGMNEDDGCPYFISEYKDFLRLGNSAAETLAKRLAIELHRDQEVERFGFDVPTFCGATRMQNGWFDTWEQCYDDKIKELLDYLRKEGSYSELVQKGERVRERVIPKLLGPLQIKPALLHGDLWSGNVGVDSDNGEPVIFDPSSYYGHNEADLAIARIFGGFPESFYTTYFKHYPKAEPVEQFENRLHLYELFHYLNHTVLFGGSYASSATAKMDILFKNVK